MKMDNRIFLPRIIIVLGAFLFIITCFIAITIVSKYGFKKKPVNISLVIKTIDPSYEFWQIIKSGVESACNEEGVVLTVSGPLQENDVETQIKLLESSIEQKPSAIILAANDYNMLIPTVKKINEKRIPLIIIDSGINSDIPVSLIATDNIVAGKKAGLKMMDILSNGDHVVIVSYVKGTATAIEREKGVKDAIIENPKLILDNIYYCDNLRDTASEITIKVLKDNPRIKGIIALNDPSTIGVARIIRQKNLKDKIQLVGFDNSIEEIDYLEEGVIKALIVQKPFNMGYLSVKAAIKSIRGEKVEKRIDTGANLITADNMYSEENQKLLFPIIKEIPNY
jgi:ribose transport system substrate-binding protein